MRNISTDKNLNLDKSSNGKNFTVIITSYNVGKYLRKAIDSVYNQTLKNIELIIVDDCSDDPEMLRLLDDISDNVQVIRFDKNLGVSAARNEGIKKSSSEYILCLDGDDYIEPAYLEKAKNVFESYKDVGIVSGWVRLFGMSNSIWVPQNDIDLLRILTDNRINSGSCFRKEASVKAGMYDEKLRSFEDWDNWIKIIKDGWKVKVIPEILLNYRVHENSKYQRKGIPNADFYCSQVINNHKELYEKHFVEIISLKHKQTSLLHKQTSLLNQRLQPTARNTVLMIGRYFFKFLPRFIQATIIRFMGILHSEK